MQAWQSYPRVQRQQSVLARPKSAWTQRLHPESASQLRHPVPDLSQSIVFLSSCSIPGQSHQNLIGGFWMRHQMPNISKHKLCFQFHCSIKHCNSVNPLEPILYVPTQRKPVFYKAEHKKHEIMKRDSPPVFFFIHTVCKNIQTLKHILIDHFWSHLSFLYSFFFVCFLEYTDFMSSNKCKLKPLDISNMCLLL